MNPFTMVVAIVLILAVATVARALISGHGSSRANRDLEARVRALETRIAALEELQPDSNEPAGA